MHPGVISVWPAIRAIETATEWYAIHGLMENRDSGQHQDASLVPPPAEDQSHLGAQQPPRGAQRPLGLPGPGCVTSPARCVADGPAHRLSR